MIVGPFSLTAQPSYRIKLCPGTKQARTALAQYLSNYKDEKPDRMIPWLQKWAKDNRMRVAFVQLERIKDRKSFQWHSGRSERSGNLVDQELAILGSRSSTTRILERDIRCFFSDTLVVMDTLRFSIGSLKNSEYFFKTTLEEWAIPLHIQTGELMIYAPASLAKGKHYAFQLIEKKGNQSREITAGILYFLTIEEQMQIKSAFLNRLEDEKLSCQTLLEESIPFLEYMWGRKSCEEKNNYEEAQADRIKILLGRCK